MVSWLNILKRAVLIAALFAWFGVASAEEAASSLLGLPDGNARSIGEANVAKIELGKELFFDRSLSSDGNVSCATCHQAEKAFTDGKTVAEGVGGRKGSRNTPSLINASYLRTQFWDGRRATLEEQVLDPLFNPNEHGLLNESDLLRRIRENKAYAPLIKQAFNCAPADLRISQVSEVLAAFVRTVVAAGSAVDQYLFAGNSSALTASQVRGLELFRGQAQCATCHLIGQRDALFTDHQYHSLSVGFDALAAKLPVLAQRLAKADSRERDRLIIADPDVAALGRFVVTLDPKDIGKFKTPSLRDIAQTAPYMHDGSVATLEQAVEREIYYRGRAMGRPLILTPSERVDLVAFLRALAGQGIANR